MKNHRSPEAGYDKFINSHLISPTDFLRLLAIYALAFHVVGNFWPTESITVSRGVQGCVQYSELTERQSPSGQSSYSHRARVLFGTYGTKEVTSSGNRAYAIGTTVEIGDKVLLLESYSRRHTPGYQSTIQESLNRQLNRDLENKYLEQISSRDKIVRLELLEKASCPE